MSISNSNPAGQPAPRSLIRAELGRIAERFEAADRRAKRAAVLGDTADRESAETERRVIAGEFWAAGQDLADMLLLLLRNALQHRREALCGYLCDALQGELEPLAEALARLEARK